MCVCRGRERESVNRRDSERIRPRIVFNAASWQDEVILTRSRAASSWRSRTPILDPISSRGHAHPAVCSPAWGRDRRWTCYAYAPSLISPPRRRTSFPARWRRRAGSGGSAGRRRSSGPVWSTACRPCGRRTSYILWTGSPSADDDKSYCVKPRARSWFTN